MKGVPQQHYARFGKRDENLFDMRLKDNAKLTSCDGLWNIVDLLKQLGKSIECKLSVSTNTKSNY